MMRKPKCIGARGSDTPFDSSVNLDVAGSCVFFFNFCQLVFQAVSSHQSKSV